MVQVKASYKTKFNAKPCRYKTVHIPHPWTEDQCQHSRRSCDTEPQPFDHDVELLMQDRSFRFLLAVSFGLVDVQPYNIEHATEQGDDENNMKRFDVVVHDLNRESFLVDRLQYRSSICQSNLPTTVEHSGKGLM